MSVAGYENEKKVKNDIKQTREGLSIVILELENWYKDNELIKT